MPPMRMVHEVDPREVIYKKIGMTKDLIIPGFTLMGNRVLVGLYERPEKTASGIHLPDKYRSEDLHQGKSGLVLALGHSAFKTDDHFDFGPDKLKVGDWCMLFVSHGLQCAVNGVPCRIIRDQDITMAIPAPDQVW